MDINKIDSIDKAESQSARGKPQRLDTPLAGQPTAGEPVQTPAHPSEAAATVQISETARLLEVASDPNLSAPVDDERLNSIRAAIAQGDYHVDPQRLAAQILRLEDELFG